MARRPFIDGAGASTTPNKLKKYKLSKEGGLVEVVGLSTLSNTEIGLSGNKSDVRNIEDLQRNDTVLVRNIKEVQDLLTTESGTRSTSDTTLQNNIDAEETARISAVNTVSSNLTSEESSRTIADSGLDTRVSSLENAPTYAPLVSSATVPLGPNAGDQWYNTDTNVLYIYLHDGDSSQWIDISTDTLMADYVASSTYTSEQAAQDTLISNTLAAVNTKANNDLSNVAVLPANVVSQLTGATGAQGPIGNTGASGNDVTVTTATSGSPSGGSDGDMFFTIIT
jgi:hypothetical protein